jgi:hypothetical protein
MILFDDLNLWQEKHFKYVFENANENKKRQKLTEINEEDIKELKQFLQSNDFNSFFNLG